MDEGDTSKLRTAVMNFLRCTKKMDRDGITENLKINTLEH